MLKIAFIHVVPSGDAYQISFPPLGIGWIVAVARRELRQVEFAFFNNAEAAVAWQPDIVGLSSDTGCMGWALEAARTLRAETGALLILGGSHVSALPHCLHTEFDMGIIGEGEYTFVELIQLIQATGGGRAKLPSSSDLMKVRGLVWHDGGAVVQSPARPLIANLDDLPFPDRDFMGNYAVPTWLRVHTIMARGCPYKCHFCASSARWESLRQSSPERVVEEITMLRERYQPTEIYIVDDLLVADRKRLRKICDMMHDRGLDKGLVIRAHGRANVIDEELIELLVKYNIIFLDFGIESNSAPVLKYMNKTGVTPAVNQRAMDLCAQGKISVGASLIIGSPDETHEDVQQTYDFVERNANVIDRVSVGTLVPLPGTPLWRESVERGIVDEHMDWSRFATYAPPGKERECFERYPVVAQRLSRDELFDWHTRIIKLGEKSNAKGEAKFWELVACEQHNRAEANQSQLDELRGSRVVRAAMGLRRMKGGTRD